MPRNLAHDLSVFETIALTVIAKIASKPSTSSSAPYSPFTLPSISLKRPARTLLRHSLTNVSNRRRSFAFGGDSQATSLPGRMTARKPVAITAVVCGSNGEHSLVVPSNKQLCFSWTYAEICRFGSAWYNIHACKLCSDSTHGVSTCKYFHRPVSRSYFTSYREQSRKTIVLTQYFR
ncbi:hypothetical protein K439DRAFT_348791 [Ramaria rubella]|nr:hypothetical protein K439DRAFT_348791 [Ramaria rubella]